MTSRSSADLGGLAFLGDAAFPAEHAGSKAATLHELAAAGFAVPPGFVVPATASTRPISTCATSRRFAAG